MHAPSPVLAAALAALGLGAASCAFAPVTPAAAPAPARFAATPPAAPTATPPVAAQASPTERPEPADKRLGILVFPGVQVIDFTGPYEVLTGAFANGRRVFDVVTVGLSPGELDTSPPFAGLHMRPDFTLDDCPRLDVLVVPGGEIDAVSDDPRAMAWLAKAVGEAECVMSVCNGAFLLAKGGHLKNQRATTFYWFIDELKDDEPTCTPVHDERFVDNGKIITTAGLTSGIDGALHLIERYTDHFTAEQRAFGLEYHWQPESRWTRGNLADRHYITMVGAGFDFPDGAVRDWRTVENTGDEDHWTKRWTFRSELPRAELLALLEPKARAAWRRSAAPADSAWEFEDGKGAPWTAAFTLVAGPDASWTLALDIDRR